MKTTHPAAQGNIWPIALLLSLCLALLFVPACRARQTTPVGAGEATLPLSSAAFPAGDRIPAQHTCDGEDVSPPLAWGQPPAGIRSFALIVDDPDAPLGVFTHWVLFNIPADSRQLPEAIPAQGDLTSGARQGKNGFGKIGYGGPCPPRGRPHRYQFTLYALDQSLDLKAGASKKEVIEAMRGHILARGQLTGTYQR